MPNQIKTFDDFKKELVASPDLQNKFKQDPLNAVQQFQAESPLTSDKWIYRIVVLALGITILSIIIGVIVLIGVGKISEDKTVPTILTAIGSAAIGALAGLLAPTPKGN
jgi:hypothetical protein